MKRLLVLSDTHWPHRGSLSIHSLVEGMDAIIHCGDLQEEGFYEELCSYGIPVHAVLGNNGDYLLSSLLPDRLVLSMEGVRIGVVHGNGPHPKALMNARRAFAGEQLDLVLFGHSHVPEDVMIEDCRFVNPGSLTSSRRGYNSYGIIKIEGKELQVEILPYPS